MKKISLITLLFCVVLSSCMKKTRCEYDACSNKAPDAEITALQDYMSTNGIAGYTKHCSGVFYKIETAGTGNHPTPCSGITFKYKGMLTSGTVFDQSTVDVYYNLGQLIRGWRNVLPLIGAGGRIIMYIPPSLGYGAYPPNGSGIPVNANLVFEIDLVAAQ